MYFVYILECVNGCYYIGYTTDINRRYQEHLEGSAKCKYTRSFPPKRLAVYWKIEGSLSVVLKLECALKKLSRKIKNQLINHPELLQDLVKTIITDNEQFLVVPQIC